jgi:hypothetical protein
MSGWELGTWISIGVLVFGSLAVFGWFLVDAVRWWRHHPERRRNPSD